ncbi:YggS family pyridoxal phosphate-dependent enzyme [soil metagenome]
MSIKNNVQKFLEIIKGTDCKLIAVSKTKSVDDILEAYHAGIKSFGENKVQEIQEKHPLLPLDIEWHMIGHLQRNKVKYIAPFIHTIHSVDSLKLLKELNKEAEKNSRIINCLLQMHIAEEETKFGFSEEELLEVLNSDELKQLNDIKISGLMGMATYTDNESQIRKEFRYLKNLFEKIKEKVQLPNVALNELSMGMSGDYRIALEEGSTMIRVGSSIFGSRSY